jgi:hypothetical protein
MSIVLVPTDVLMHMSGAMGPVAWREVPIRLQRTGEYGHPLGAAMPNQLGLGHLSHN